MTALRHVLVTFIFMPISPGNYFADSIVFNHLTYT